MLNPLLSFYTVLGLLLMGELVLRMFTPKGILLRVPAKHVFGTDEHTTPGIRRGRKTFSVNNVGLRGPNLPENSNNLYKIITVGGSTTECLYLDDSEEWPHLLMGKMNTGQNQRLAWIANAGLSGHTAAHHLRMIQIVPVFGKVDMLIFLVGFNDLQDSLAFEGASTESELDRIATEWLSALHAGVKWGPVFRRSQIFLAVRNPLLALKTEGSLTSEAERWYGPLRRRRGNGKVLPLPDLRVGAAEFRERILQLSTECRNRSLRCLFLTQPTMWRDNLTPEEQNLLWFGWIGPVLKPRGYVSVSDLARAMDLYNRTLLETCLQNGMECYDLAAFIPQNTSALFDDCHFNEGGARMAAELLSDYLLSRPPFLPTQSILRVH